MAFEDGSRRRGRPMTETETIRLLRRIRDLAFIGYPYDEKSEIDPNLLLCLGRIASDINTVIANYNEKAQCPE
jgi:hypothetical protein